MDQSWIKQASKSIWKEVFHKVKHAVVFMDNQCAESLFWCGGPMELFSAGASDIKDFSSFECGNAHQKKAVFVISSVLQGKTMSILQDIIEASKFDYCVVVTAIDIDAHRIAYGIDMQTGRLIFEQFEEKICEWMGNINFTSEVVYAPVFMACYSPFLFLIPSLNNFFPLQNHDTTALDSMRRAKGEKHPIQRLSDVHFYSLPIGYQTQIKQLVMYFNQLFETLSVKEELFAVGSTSRLITTQLANLPSGRQRRKVAATTASLVLIDRSLDAVAISRHSDTSLVDKILGILPELPGHCNNISVDMLKLTTAKTLLSDKLSSDKITEIRNMVSCPGCLCPPDDACPQLLQDIITLPQKDALALIERSLMEACVEEGIEVSDEEETDDKEKHISQLVESFYGNAGAIMYHNNLLQLSTAASQTLTNSFHKKWMKLSGMEKLIILDEDPIAKIIELSNETGEDGSKQWTVEDILGLLLFACSCKNLSNTSDDTWDDLSSSLSLLISDSSYEELPEGLSEILGICEGSENEADLDLVQDVVEQTIAKAKVVDKWTEIKPNIVLKTVCHRCNIFTKVLCCLGTMTRKSDTQNLLSAVTSQINTIKGLSSCRQRFNHFQRLLKSSLGPPTYKSLITQLMERILDPSKPDLQPDVEHVSTGLMDLLKSGFSMFKKVSQPRPNDGKVLFIFVVGGITFEEAAVVERMVRNYNSRQQSNLQVIVGSTRIASPRDAIDKILFANNLSPTIND